MVDALDSKSSIARCEGSSPSSGTIDAHIKTAIHILNSYENKSPVFRQGLSVLHDDTQRFFYLAIRSARWR